MFSLVRTCVFTNTSLHLTGRIQNIVTKPKKKGWQTRYAKRQSELKKKEEYSRQRSLLEKYKDAVPLIECKNPALNHYKNNTYSKFTPLPLASNGWFHRRSAGDYFTIFDAVPSEEELQKLNEKLQGVPNLMRMEDFGFTNTDKDNETLISFSDLGLSPELLKAVGRLGIKMPSEIQRRGISTVLKGRSAILTAETGCGKTLAFLLPLIEHILHYKSINARPKEALDSPFVLVISPSRELASQTYSVANYLAKHVSFIPKLILGGETGRAIRQHDYSEVDMVIGSLGGISKFITRGVLLTNHVRGVVLDEADTLLDENFSEKLMHLLKRRILVRPKLSIHDPGVQLIMVSATMPETLPDKLHTVIPLESFEEITTKEHAQVLPKVKQTFIRVNHTMRASLLLDLVRKDVNKGDPVIIFSHTSKSADWVTKFLADNKIASVTLHGDLPLEQRSVAFDRFREGEVKVLSCTSMASLGLDTKWVKHVINFDAPQMMFDYIHRVGRVGRLGGPENCRVTNFVVRGAAIALAQRLEKSIRFGKGIPMNEPNVRKRIRKGND